ncbi:DUF2797 domain-containing protein [Halorientalis salina]|uniref:DUF2797 domain-containing protein n=1 Tax=Halorientalis salina TaxID=2932266 RepID=UPI0010ABA036|nr:DUF2797 domain-containing protein [Halorientalis salina]
MQIVGYDTGAGDDESDPALVLSTEEGLDRQPLVSGAELAYTLGERHCAGTVQDGRHESCPNESAPYCDDHTSRWACARCVGNCDLPLPACREEHAVYLAAFAPATFKVGVTRSWRLRTRLREQGADRAAHIRTVKDGRIARQLEAEIATDLVDRVRVPTKIAGLHRDVDEAAWRDLLAEFDVLERFDFDYGLPLSDRPVEETVLTGTVRGAQGRVLVLDNGGSTYAVDMRDLVGYECTEGGTDRELQSSLGAFG